MKGFAPKRVINGTYGELWVDGEYIAETTGFEAKITYQKEDVHQAGQRGKGTKILGEEGAGSIKMSKVTSRFIKMMHEHKQRGTQPSWTIISKLADPDAFGAERIIIKDAVPDELTLAGWELKTKGEVEIPITFSDWEPLDLIGGF